MENVERNMEINLRRWRLPVHFESFGEVIETLIFPQKCHRRAVLQWRWSYITDKFACGDWECINERKRTFTLIADGPPLSGIISTSRELGKSGI